MSRVHRAVRESVRLLAPPLAVRMARWALGRQPASEWRYVGEVWPSTDSIGGWDTPSVVDRQRRRWRSLVETTAGVGPLSVDDAAAHNVIMTFAYVIGRVARGGAPISVLDWGGGLGHYSLYAHALYPELPVDYHCRDLPLMNAAGRELNHAVTFHDSDVEAFSRSYDLVIASSSLQYERDWRSLLGRFSDSTVTHLYVTRQPFVEHAASFVVIQNSVTSSYGTEYAGWALNKGEFLGAATKLGFTLVREFVTGEEHVVPGAPERLVGRGFLFERGPS